MHRSSYRIRFTYSDLLFLAPYLICMIDAIMIGYTTLNRIKGAAMVSNVLRCAAIALAVCKIIADRAHRLRELVFSILVAVLTGIAFLRSHYNHLVYFLIIGITVWNVDIRKVIWVDFYIRIFMCVLILLGALTGVIEDYVTYRTGSMELRYSLGFSHPNTFASLIFALVLEYTWLKRRKSDVLYTLGVWLIAVIQYAITLCRTITFLLVLFPVLLLYAHRKKPIKKEVRIFWIVFTPAMVALSICSMLWCGKN